MPLGSHLAFDAANAWDACQTIWASHKTTAAHFDLHIFGKVLLSIQMLASRLCHTVFVIMMLMMMFVYFCCLSTILAIVFCNHLSNVPYSVIEVFWLKTKLTKATYTHTHTCLHQVCVWLMCVQHSEHGMRAYSSWPPSPHLFLSLTHTWIVHFLFSNESKTFHFSKWLNKFGCFMWFPWRNTGVQGSKHKKLINSNIRLILPCKFNKLFNFVIL